MLGGVPPVGVEGGPYAGRANVANLYLPVTGRTGTGGTFPVYPGMEPGGYQVPGTAPSQQQVAMGNAPRAPGTTGTGTGSSGYRPPPGVSPQWYEEFKQQHQGQAPEQFYGGHGEGLAEALADRDWSRGFQQMTGRPPSQYDWENWYYQSRYGGRPGPPRGTREYQAMRAAERYKRERRAKKWRRKKRLAEGTETKEGNPSGGPVGSNAPLWVPPQITWR